MNTFSQILCVLSNVKAGYYFIIILYIDLWDFAAFAARKQTQKKINVFCVSMWLCDKLLTCPGWTSPVPDDSWEKWTPATLMTRSAGEAAVENETRRSYTIEIVQ